MTINDQSVEALLWVFDGRIIFKPSSFKSYNILKRYYSVYRSHSVDTSKLAQQTIVVRKIVILFLEQLNYDS